MPPSGRKIKHVPGVEETLETEGIAKQRKGMEINVFDIHSAVVEETSCPWIDLIAVLRREDQKPL